ncbi:hypothetical protein BH09BAC4_BH09BAC4_18190 [soil metagenome]
MNKLILFLSFIGLVSCQADNQPSDVAARASGKFVVKYYVVNGDTLYSAKGVNKIDVSDFYVQVDRKEADSVRVGIFYTKNGFNPTMALRDVGVSETNGKFQLSARTEPLSTYEGRIEGNTFYEHTEGSAIMVWLTDSPPVPISSIVKGVVISAQK